MQPVHVELPVLWGDMDALGHVNNTIYARWFEQARIEYFAASGLRGEEGAGPILARQAIDFVAPVFYPDRISVSVRATRIGTTSLTLSYEATSQQKSGAVVARGESVVVLYDYAAGKKVPIGPELRRRLEGGAPGLDDA